MGKLDDFDGLLENRLDPQEAERVRRELDDRGALLGWLGWNARQQCNGLLGQPKERAEFASMAKRLVAHVVGWGVVYAGLKSLPLNEFGLFAGPAEFWAIGFLGVEVVQAGLLRRLPVGTPWEGIIGAIVGLIFGVFGVLLGMGMVCEAAGWTMPHRWGYRAVAACVCLGCLLGMGPGFGLRKRLLLGEIRWGEILGTWWYKAIVFFVPSLAFLNAGMAYMWGMYDFWGHWWSAAGVSAVLGFLASTGQDGIPVGPMELVLVSIGSLVHRGLVWAVCVIGIAAFLGVDGRWCWPAWASLTALSVWGEFCGLASRGFEGWRQETLSSLAEDADLAFIGVPLLAVWMVGWAGLAGAVAVSVGIDLESVLAWAGGVSFVVGVALWQVFLRGGAYVKYLPGPIAGAIFWRRQPSERHSERWQFRLDAARYGLVASVRVLMSPVRATSDLLFAVPRALTWASAM